MTRVESSLKGLIRRVKKHMGAVFITTAIFFMTFGFYLMFEQPQYKIYGAIGVSIGIICWLVAYLLAYRKEKKERQERMEERERQQAQWVTERTESRELLKAILGELKKLNQSKEARE